MADDAAAPEGELTESKAAEGTTSVAEPESSAITLLRLGTRVGAVWGVLVPSPSWPLPFSPQHFAVPFARSAQAWDEPAATRGLQATPCVPPAYPTGQSHLKLPGVSLHTDVEWQSFVPSEHSSTFTHAVPDRS